MGAERLPCGILVQDPLNSSGAAFYSKVVLAGVLRTEPEGGWMNAVVWGAVVDVDGCGCVECGVWSVRCWQ